AVEAGFDPVTAPWPRSPASVTASSAASFTVALSALTNGWPFATVIVSVDGEVSPSPSVIVYFITSPPALCSSLFPYTTLFRSNVSTPCAPVTVEPTAPLQAIEAMPAAHAVSLLSTLQVTVCPDGAELPSTCAVGTSSTIEIDTVEVEVLPTPSVTVKVNTSRPGSVLLPLLASGEVWYGAVSV